MDIYQKIQIAVKQKGLTIQQLEKKLGLPHSALYKYKTHSPSIDKIQAIAKTLGISVSELLGESVDNTYYLDEDTAEAAQSIRNSKEMKALFSAAKDSRPEDLITVSNLLLSLKRKERYDGENPT